MKRKGASHVFRNLGQVWQMACRNRRGSCHAGKYFFYAGRKSGATKAEANAANERANDREAIAVRQVNEAREASEQQVKAVQNAKYVASDNSTFDDDEIARRLRDEWSRD